MFKRWNQVLWAPDAEGSGGAEGEGQAASGITPPHDEATLADKGAAAKKVPERPEWAPENFWDKDKGELRIEELAKGFTETKKKLSMRTDDLTKALKDDFEKTQFSGRPESPDKYELRVPQGVLPEGVEWEFNQDDPLVAAARQFVFAKGGSQDDFDALVGKFIESEIAKLPDIETEQKRLGEKGAERVKRVDQWLSANVSRGAYAVLSKYATNADMVVAIEELMTKAGAPAFVLDGDALRGQDILTETQVKTWMSDPKYWDPQKRDPVFVKKVEEAWGKLYPKKK